MLAEATAVSAPDTAAVDPATVGRGLEVIMTFSLQNQSTADVQRFVHAMLEMDEVLSCAQVLGRFDFIASVAVKDVAALERFINEKVIALGPDTPQAQTAKKALESLK